MRRKTPDYGAITPSEHLEQWLKSSYAERLNWLEEVNKFTNQVLTKKQKQLKAKLRKGQYNAK